MWRPNEVDIERDLTQKAYHDAAAGQSHSRAPPPRSNAAIGRGLPRFETRATATAQPFTRPAASGPAPRPARDTRGC